MQSDPKHPAEREPEMTSGLETSGPGSGSSGPQGPVGDDSRRARPPRRAVRYLGFRATAAGREYTLSVSSASESRVFVMLIPHEAFASREVRFQDAPDLCFAKLESALAVDADLRPGPRLVLATQDLLDYRDARERRSGSEKGARPRPRG